MSTTSGPKIVDDGLIFYYDIANTKCYPGTGTAVTDLSGAATGTLVNSPTYADNAFTFVTNKYISATAGSAFNFGTGDFTLTMWLKPNSLGTSQIYFSKYLTWTTNLDMVLRYAASKLAFLAGDTIPIGVDSDGDLTLSAWHYVVVRRSAGTTNMYMNGVIQADSHTGSVSIPNDQTNIRIGYSHDNDEPVNGSVAMCSFYSRAITQSEITQNFDATRSRYGI